MSKRLFKTMVAVLAIAAAAAGPVRGQSNQKYTSAVAMSALQVGDTLAEGFSLTGEDANFIYLVANRHKHNENLSGSLENITLGWIQSIGANCVFSTLVNEQSITFAPVDENGRDGDAWVVTEVESIEDFTNITIAGIRIPGPPITVRMAEGTEDAANWSIASGNASVPGTQVLENVMSGSQVTATYNGTTKKVKSVKAVKYVPLIVNPVVGQFIGSDGKNYDANATLPTGVTAVAKIVYVGSDNGEAAPYNHGLALALSDASNGCYWKTSHTDAGHTKQTSSTFTEESGLQYNATHNSDDYPAFKAAITYSPAAPTGCSAWFLASGYQWKKMIGAAGLSNLGLKGKACYWSSSEKAANYAWYFYTNGGGQWYDGYKDSDGPVRACLAF